MNLDPKVEQRLQSEANIWLATVRADGRPHLVPIWFVWHDAKVYLCTEVTSVKVRNLLVNPQVALSLEDGSQPIVIEGLARTIDRAEAEAEVVAAFQQKYDWNILTDDQYTQVIEIEPRRIRS
jgi:PPOX class probable F420-dependent enzyme